jgi:hypothetical protein
LGISLSIPVGLSFLPPTPFAIVACYPFTCLILLYSISSTLTLLMAKDGICNTNDHSSNNTRNPPSLEVLLVMHVDVSYVAQQAHEIVNVALHREYSPGIIFIFSQGRKNLIMSKTNTGSNTNEYY